ncbi:hypothetical protein N7492_001448 [Penicillium capsulatum]|uniref:Glycosyltransferase family 25 protein n=1 Tax=Penicillium capsulatum TaxID=69766 RepID=A0A9W9M158_9EURO|nr:hypothetical protein N7492_001448 [Penicillium capsulatum]KAJ6129498.1 hypothetical protein N7512_002278 [Penicillium capsulatum]
MIQRRPIYSVLLAIFVILLTGWFFTGDNGALSSALDGPALLAGNDTLGFQKILVLSDRPTWRTRGLQAAANLTNLDITIPPKPPVDDRLAKSFMEIDQDNGYNHPAFGASKAWLSHLDIVKYVYQSNMETALILEDDADWDIAIRDQMQNLSTAVRQLIKPPENDSTPYTRDWDVLWIGHCGAVWSDDRDTVGYNDTNIPPRDHYKSYRADDIKDLPEEERIVFRSAGPICTFAYAVTHEGAGKILAGMGAGQGEAFDVEMSWECDRGHLRCLAVVPELVNEYSPPAEYNVKSFVAVGNGADAGSKEQEFESHKGGSNNIVHSSRCQALWQEDCRWN